MATKRDKNEKKPELTVKLVKENNKNKLKFEWIKEEE